jgi:glycosyltransferase involved in cell wall biosynthesis
VFVNKIIRPLYRKFRGEILQSLIPCSKSLPVVDANHAIEVIGFFESFSGIGESARLCAKALKKAGYNVKCTSVEQTFRKKPDAVWTFDNAPETMKTGLRIFHLNPPMMPPVIVAMGIKNFRSTYNIGYWAWELEEIPSEWIKGTKYMNAIMTPSDFTSNVIRKYTDKPVETVLHPVEIDMAHVTMQMREKLGIAKETLMISTIFSFGSAMERKNPQAVIAAFQKAFTPEDDAVLILKSNSGTPEQKTDIEKLCGAHKNIRLCDGFWQREETQGLLACSDLYLSLHRSEGFGLTIAEAMLMNVPVMVTNWSGNTGFCTPDNSFLIDYKRVPVISTHPEFKGLKNLTWAEADTDQAAKILKDIKADRSKLNHMKQNVCKSLEKSLIQQNYERALLNGSTKIKEEREAL